MPRTTAQGLQTLRNTKGLSFFAGGELKQQQQQCFPLQDCSRDMVLILLFPRRIGGARNTFVTQLKE